jgi:hypothetical protein
MVVKSAFATILVGAAIVLPAPASFAAGETAADKAFWAPGLTGLHWDMTPQQTQMVAGAGKLLHQTPTDVLMETPTVSFDGCSILYRFRFFSNKLVAVEITIPGNGCHLAETLASRYGAPSLDSAEHRLAEWEGGPTEISLHLPPAGQEGVGWIDFSDGSIPKIPAD